MTERRRGSDNCGRVPSSAKLTTVDIFQDMRRFDRLPRELRKVLQETNGNAACVGLDELVKQWPPAAVAAVVRQVDRDWWRDLMIEEFGCVP